MKIFLIIWQNIKSSVSSTFMRYLWLRYIVLEKRRFFIKYFKLVHAPTWKIPHYMKGILFICTRQEEISIFNNFPLSARLLFLVRYIFLEKDGFSWNISSWCMPQLEWFLLIWQVFYPYVQGKRHSVSLTIFLYLRLSYALYGTFFRKRWFFMKYSSWCMPQLERFLITCRFSIHMYKARSISVSYTIFLYLRLSYALYGPFFWKRWFFMKYFKLGHWNISSWCMPQLERFLIIWQVFYPYVQGMKHSVFSTFSLYLRLPHAQ